VALVEALKDEMLMAAAALEFERAAELRDRIKKLTGGSGPLKQTKRPRPQGRRRR
jgi:excinuclease UvrABC nuclease subunit